MICPKSYSQEVGISGLERLFPVSSPDEPAAIWGLWDKTAFKLPLKAETLLRGSSATCVEVAAGVWLCSQNPFHHWPGPSLSLGQTPSGSLSSSVPLVDLSNGILLTAQHSLKPVSRPRATSAPR